MLLSADGTGEEVQELNRQNRITEQILTNFFERKFFPNRKPRPAPTIDEILPPDAKPQVPGKHKETPHGDDDELDNENLQSVESEHVDSFYRDYEGKFFLMQIQIPLFYSTAKMRSSSKFRQIRALVIVIVKLATSLAEHAHAFLCNLVICPLNDVLEQFDLIADVVELTGHVELVESDLFVVALCQHEIEMLNRVDESYRLLFIVGNEVLRPWQDLLPLKGLRFGGVVVALGIKQWNWAENW